MKPSVIVWELETVPDIGGFAAANDLVGKSDVEVREARSATNFQSTSTTRSSASESAHVAQGHGPAVFD
jgi:hypothetical protein